MADMTNQSTNTLQHHLDAAAQTTKQKMNQNPAAAQALGDTPALQDEVVDVEKELLQEIINRLNQNKMSSEDAQKVAKEFLSLLPIHDQKDLLAKLYQLSKANQGMQGVYLKFAQPYEENEKQRKLSLMSQHLHQGKIEEALSVAKGEPNG